MVVIINAAISLATVMSVISRCALNVLEFLISSYIRAMNTPSFVISNTKGDALLVVFNLIMHTDVRIATMLLHFECIILPQVVWHKCDKHFLKLIYNDENMI